ncbi:MAG: hypothetical protein RI924_1260 [Bacteroidota bacterium]|jgi:DNA-binding Xre family transcriptional regulator
MLKLNLNSLFSERGISEPCIYLIKQGIPRHTAHRILRGEPTQLHFRHIETLCKALVCTPNDLLQYIPWKDDQLSDKHPLNQLKRQPDPFNWLKNTANLPLLELQQLISQIKVQLDQKTKSEP